MQYQVLTVVYFEGSISYKRKKKNYTLSHETISRHYDPFTKVIIYSTNFYFFFIFPAFFQQLFKINNFLYLIKEQMVVFSVDLNLSFTCDTNNKNPSGKRDDLHTLVT